MTTHDSAKRLISWGCVAARPAGVTAARRPLIDCASWTAPQLLAGISGNVVPGDLMILACSDECCPEWRATPRQAFRFGSQLVPPRDAGRSAGTPNRTGSAHSQGEVQA